VRIAAILASLLVASTAFAQSAAPAPAAEPAAPAAAAAPAPVAAPAPAPAAAPAAKPSPFTFAMHGFVSMSASYQVGTFLLSEGQQSIASSTGPSPQRDMSSMNFDIRQSRFNFSVTGPQVLWGATPSGVLEIDFMQGFGAGNFGEVSLLNRLRTLYSQLDWGAHKLQLGQQNDLVFAMAPTSLSHIAFPLGYFTGNIGWRRPGIFGFHTFGSGDVKVEGAWEIGRSQWADSAACVVSPVPATSCSGVGGAAVANTGGVSLGEASGGPAVEGRITANYAKYANLWVAAHYNNVDLNGYGVAGGQQVGTTKTLQVVAYNAGLKLNLPLSSDMGLTLAATGFTGKNLQPLVANLDTGAAPNTATPIGTFRVGTQDEPYIRSQGYWAQLGFNLTKEFSLWGFYGKQNVNPTDLVRSYNTATPTFRYDNATTNLMAMYRDGGYGLSLEWIDFKTRTATNADLATLKVTEHRIAQSDQIMLTANYFF